jgi:hypothetical protein
LHENIFFFAAMKTWMAIKPIFCAIIELLFLQIDINTCIEKMFKLQLRCCQNYYSLRPILRFANTDVSTTKMCLNTSTLAKSIMDRREYQLRSMFCVGNNYHKVPSWPKLNPNLSDCKTDMYIFISISKKRICIGQNVNTKILAWPGAHLWLEVKAVTVADRWMETKRPPRNWTRN